ncbi:MAG: PKD domain-containing protein [Saprospiraceae bacterium]|nr:PKD domain-containing protein [Saprospiraceae bacterium]
MKSIGKTILFILLHFTIHSQSIFLYNKNLNLNFRQIEIHNPEYLTIETQNIYTEVNTIGQGQSLFIHTQDDCWEISLIEYDLISKSCFRNFSDSFSSIYINNLQTTKTYKVLNIHYPSIYGSLTCSPSFFSLTIPTSKGKVLIESLSNFLIGSDKKDYVLYYESAIINNHKLRCNQIEKVSEINNIVSNSSNLAKCITIDIALACDFSIVNKYGGISASEAFMTNVLNNVLTNYDNEFPTSIEFQISAIFIPENSTLDPWNGINNIDEQLTKFKNWANGGGFGSASYAVATAWTTKYVGTFGLAYLSSLCSNERYNVCSDFGVSISILRCLQAHELGHNFNCSHDSGGSPYIMAPGISASNAWSSTSVSAIENFILTAGCKGICSSNREPISDFQTSSTILCPGNSVQFSDLSFGDPTSWQWKFPGGTPSISSLQNPIVFYNSEGVYDVTLKAINSFGSNEIIRVKYIQVDQNPIPEFTYFTREDTLFLKNLSQNSFATNWEFGDGKQSVEDDPSHIYAKDGKYEVKLCASNSCATKCKLKTIEIKTLLKAEIVTTNRKLCIPTKLSLYSKSNGNRFYWQLDGPESIISHEANPVLVLKKHGVYNVYLAAYRGLDSVKVIKKAFLNVLSPAQCPKISRKKPDPED